MIQNAETHNSGVEEGGQTSPNLNQLTKASTFTAELLETLEESSPSSHPSVATKEHDVELTEEDMRQRRRSCYQKAAVAAALLVFVIFVIIDSQTNGYVRSGISAFLEWVEKNPGAGMIAFMLVYFVATILFVPGSILTLGAGFVFSASFASLGIGILLGVISVFLGASGGAIVSFLLGRYLFRDSVGRLSKKYSVFEALDIALAEKGLRIMILLRLSPIIPFTIINYVAGVTAISFWNYCLALFAIIPGTTLYVFLGASAGTLAESFSSGDNSTITIIVVVVGIIFGIIAVLYTSYYAKKELNKAVARRQAELDGAPEEDHPNERKDDDGDDTDMEKNPSKNTELG